MTGHGTPDRTGAFPPPLTPDSAAQAQRALRPGSGKCVLCGADIWRYYTSGDTEHLTMFDETLGGSWDFPPSPEAVYGWVARRLGAGRGDLSPHNCLEDGR